MSHPSVDSSAPSPPFPRPAGGAAHQEHPQSAAPPALAIVLGMSATGLSTLRLLAQHGVHCWGVDARLDMPGFASRYCARRILLRDASVKELARTLQTATETSSVRPVVVPTSDHFVRLLSALHNPIRGRLDIALPAPRVVADILDKQRFAERATQLGLRVPMSVAKRGTAHLEEVALRVGYPVLVKPRAPDLNEQDFSKALILETAEDVRSLQDRFGELSATELLVQEYVPGDDLHHVSVAVALDRASRPLATFVARKRRQGNHGVGVGTFVETHRDDEAAEAAVKFLQQIGYVGVAEMELKRHAKTGELFAIEVNPRLWSQVMLPAATGVNFAMLYCQIATGAVPEDEVHGETPAATWQDIWGDFYWTFCHDGYWRRGEVSIKDWLSQTLHSRTGATFEWRDPLPAIKRLRQGMTSSGKKA